LHVESDTTVRVNIQNTFKSNVDTTLNE